MLTWAGTAENYWTEQCGPYLCATAADISTSWFTSGPQWLQPELRAEKGAAVLSGGHRRAGTPSRRLHGADAQAGTRLRPWLQAPVVCRKPDPMAKIQGTWLWGSASWAKRCPGPQKRCGGCSGWLSPTEGSQANEDVNNKEHDQSSLCASGHCHLPAYRVVWSPSGKLDGLWWYSKLKAWFRCKKNQLVSSAWKLAWAYPGGPGQIHWCHCKWKIMLQGISHYVKYTCTLLSRPQACSLVQSQSGTGPAWHWSISADGR